ncbi:MAG TPA: hypothetical protein VFC84_03215 [Desulfosporosinus sp.]|nr:hypothetical protein [Desulfosporosinus sp.]
MAYLASGTKSKHLLDSSVIPLLQRLSLGSVKGISVFLLLGIVGGFLVFWQPAYLQFRSLETEQTRWQEVLRAGTADTNMNTKLQTTSLAIPTMDQLPDIIDQCRGAFVKEGVVVASLNVERFGEQRESVKGLGLDYGLVRLQLKGPWEGIVTSLKALEETPVGNIHLQEVVLNTQGGEALLKIYFSMGE